MERFPMIRTTSRLPAYIAACCVVLLSAGLAYSKAIAHDFKLGALTIDHPWARASAGPVHNGAAYLTVHNSGAADSLVAVSGDVAERVELHTHLMEGDVMKMRRVEAVEVPAHGMAALEPGGFHVMLIGLAQPLKEGQHFPLTLTFRDAGEVAVEVKVEAVGSMGPAGAGHGTMEHGTMDHGKGAPSN
jgi:copper(I)-binding protein